MSALAPAATPPVEAATTVSASNLLAKLKVTTEKRASSYDREDFTHWNDVDADCLDARAEVLVEESKKATTGSCSIKTGRWKSLFDGKVVTRASKLDIDHMVPLAEAWRSGAYKWSAEKREAYANDVGYEWSLIAVTAKTNRSKGDRDPAEWLPAKAQCTYAKAWVGVKSRWKLTVDKAEKKAIRAVLGDCDSKSVAKPGKPKIIELAVVVPKPTSTPTPEATPLPTQTPQPPAPPQPTATPTTPPATGTDPDYGTCAAAKRAGANTPYYRDVDPEYYFYRDTDGDGIVCE